MSQLALRRSSNPSRNLLCNNVMAGAVDGTPGTFPRGWGPNLDTTNGVNSQIVGVSTENGIRRLDWRVWGTPIAASATIVLLMPFPSPIHGKTGDAFVLSAYIKLIAGSLPVGVDLTLNEHDATGGFLGYAPFVTHPTSASLSSQRFKNSVRLQQLTVAQAMPVVAITYGAGTAFDATVGIGLPQLERGQVMTLPERRLAV